MACCDPSLLSTVSFTRKKTTAPVGRDKKDPSSSIAPASPSSAARSTFKHGSTRMGGEGALFAVPGVRWLGARSADVPEPDDDGHHRHPAVLPLTKRRALCHPAAAAFDAP